jgi:hypothetical protein
MKPTFLQFHRFTCGHMEIGNCFHINHLTVLN